MDKTKLFLRAWASVVTMVVIASVTSASTYAWFSHNRQVQAETVSTRSGTETLTLEIASAAAGPYSEEAAITQTNTAKELMPVSTDNLVTFYRGVNVNEDDNVDSFVQTTDQYYVGRVYLRTTGQGMPIGAQMALYLDVEGIRVDEKGAEAGLMRNAARVGLIIGTENANGSITPVTSKIFDLGDEPGKVGKSNTELETGTPDGPYVLSKPSDPAAQPVAVPDPSVAPAEYTITETASGITLPKNSLCSLELNAVYVVEVYYYIEGCDSDCTSDISETDMYIQLPFFGVLQTGGEA